jgi:hypothetical protein
MLILIRRDDPDYKVELVRWQNWLHGYWGYTRQMIRNHRTAALFLKSVWQIGEQNGLHPRKETDSGDLGEG